MRLRDVTTIYRKELRETLRDRRTLIVMVLLPLVMYPLTSVLVAEWLISHEAGRQAQPSRVLLGGAAGDAGGLPDALRAPEAQIALTVAPGLVVPRDARGAGRLPAAADAVVVVPEGFAASLAVGKAVPLQVFYDGADDASKLAEERIGRAVAAFALAERDRRLAQAGLEPAFVEPVTLAAVDVATRAKLGRAEIGKVLPFIIVLMVLMGSFYPAIDLTAGEKERGTLEPLFATPMPRQAIVAGKFLTVATVSALTGLLNVLCMAGAALWIARSAAAAAGAGLPFGALVRGMPWGAVGMSLVALAVATLLFSALMMAVASLARNFKEAQNFLTPVYLVATMPAMSAWLPGTKLGWGAAFVPIANVTLLMKDAITGSLSAGPAILALAVTGAYAAFAMSIAARIYDSERLLFAPDEPSAPRRRSWIFGLLGAKPKNLRPSPPLAAGEALGLWGVVAVLMFTAGSMLQVRGLGGIAASQWLLVALPVVLFAARRGEGVRDTLALRAPRPAHMAGAFLIGASGWYVLNWLVLPLQERIAPTPPALREALQNLVPVDASLSALLFALAISPGICEELLSRGVLARAFRAPLGTTGAVILSAFLFGVLHFSIYRFLPTFLLGIGLGTVTLAAGSLYPAMLIHALNNAAVILLATPRGAGVAAWLEARSLAMGVLALVALATGFALVLLPRNRSR